MSNSTDGPQSKRKRKDAAEVNHGSRPTFPDTETVLDQFQKWVVQTPDAVALVLPEGEFVDGVRLEISYAEMAKVIDQTATELTRMDAKTGSQWVILVLPQGLQQVCAVWGVLRAGCGYVPLDSETQAPRLRMIFPEVTATVCIGEPGETPLKTVSTEFGIPLGTYPNGAREGLVVSGGAAAASPPLLPAAPALLDYALLLFSSGSTGVPKGIIYDHTWLMGCAYFVAVDHLGLNRHSHTLLRCSYVWSVGLYDFFPANLVGGTLFIPPKGGHMNVQYMAETIARETIHALVIQPTLLNLLLDENKNSASYPLRSLKHVVSSGEKLFTSTADTFVRAPGLNAKLWNMYGSTEAGCTYFVAASGEAAKLAAYSEGVPAGIPQPYVDVWVMRLTDDPKHPLSPVPTGEAGEIVFGGGGKGFLSRGYWRNPALTDEKFLMTEYGRVYRTGDAGVWQDGQLLVTGRLDRQVKVRGVRIQPEEIEARLKRYTDETGDMPVKACAVVPSAHEPIELTAFLETAEGKPLDTSMVIAFLKQELGRVYVPRYVEHLPEGLPRTASGKPDMGKLRQLAASREDVVGSAAADAGDEAEDSLYRGASTSISGSVILNKGERSGAVWTWDVDLRSRLWKFTQDHRYKGEQLFPGSGYLSLAAEACQAMLWPGWELQDLSFSKPLPLATPRPLRVTATTEETGAVIRVSSLPDLDGDWILHCECRGLRLASPPEAYAMQSIPAAITGQRCVAELYSQLADGGFDYGPQFQSLRSVFLGGESAGGEVVHRHQSTFVIDPVDIDACFQITPLVSPLGFQGAPTAMKRVRYFNSRSENIDILQVLVSLGVAGIDFTISSNGIAICLLEGLQLQAFDTSTPELLQLVSVEYSVTSNIGWAPRVIAIGSGAEPAAKQLANMLHAEDVYLWAPGAPLSFSNSRSFAFVVQSKQPDAEIAAGLEALLPDMCHELPFGGRVWFVIVATTISDGAQWMSLAYTWAATYPALMLSVLLADDVGPSALALLDKEAPPFLDGMRYNRVEPLASRATDIGRFAGLSLDSPLAVLSSEATPLAGEIVAALRSMGATATLILPDDQPVSAPATVLLCAITPASVARFEPICAAAGQCVTICAADAFVPSTHSRRAWFSTEAALRSRRRSQAGHKSWVIFAPPLMNGLWFEPPAPAGFHRCPVKAFVAALTEASAADSIVGLSEEYPKHWRSILHASAGSESGRSAAELRAFLLKELALGAIDESRTLEELGVGSLAMLKLSQRLRRFIGREFSAFALQGNPTVKALIEVLSKKEAYANGLPKRGRVLCLHGFRTSSTVLSQQMEPLVPILQRHGYELVVPDGPHVSKGDAQGAAGLDDEDSYGWWLYDGESHESTPLGLEQSIELLQGLKPIDAVIGFSQGGAMAAQVADMLQAKWALLFSPVYVPKHPAKCSCPTLVALDPAEEVFPYTQKLLDQLPARTKQLKHDQGHRLPVASSWWDAVGAFLDGQTDSFFQGFSSS